MMSIEHCAPRRAKARHLLPEPRVSLPLLAALRVLGRIYARLGLKIDGLEFRHPERILRSWRDFHEGRSRLIVAFRHPYGDEPQLLSWALATGLAREARRLGAGPLGRLHARFVHGYEVPLWSGPLVRWILPRFGAMPVYHAKLEKKSMERIRAVLRDGDYPLILAPEGQTSYRSETLPRLERGTARLGFWCAGELERLGRGERIEVLPVSVHYRYYETDIGMLEDLVAGLESDCSLSSGESRPERDAEGRKLALAARLAALDLRLVEMAEAYYYGTGHSPRARDRDSRLAALIEEALRRGEAAFGLKPVGDQITRVYRIRQEGWDRIYPEGDLARLSPLEKRLADRRAGEAWYAMRHMEFVDLCWYLDSLYIKTVDGSAPPFGRLVESAYSAADLASRLAGGDISHRPNALRHGAVLSIGEPIDLRARYAGYLKDRKAAVEAATRDLEREYLECIREFIAERER
jgi:hypothetical protein